MPRGKKTSSEKIAEVIVKKLKKPDKTIKEIANETNVSKSTVGEILLEKAPEVRKSSDYSKKLIEENIKIIQEGKEIILQQIKKLNKKGGVKIVSVSDIKSLSSTIEEAFKQNQLLNGGNTENTEIKIKIIE